MNTPKSWTVRGIVALVALLLFTPLPSHADTYSVFALANDNRGFLGLDNTGKVFFTFVGISFDTYTNGVFTGSSSSSPIFIADNGTACTPSVPAGGSVVRGICNNGRDAFTGKLTSSQVFPGLYVGPTFASIFAGVGGLTPYPYVFAMNSLGDIVFDDQANDIWYEAVDLTTSAVPEPSALVLLFTSLIAFAGFGLYRQQLPQN